jgi:hypothetical protein
MILYGYDKGRYWLDMLYGNAIYEVFITQSYPSNDYHDGFPSSRLTWDGVSGMFMTSRDGQDVGSIDSQEVFEDPTWFFPPQVNAADPQCGSRHSIQTRITRINML